MHRPPPPRTQRWNCHPAPRPFAQRDRACRWSRCATPAPAQIQFVKGRAAILGPAFQHMGNPRVRGCWSNGWNGRCSSSPTSGTHLRVADEAGVIRHRQQVPPSPRWAKLAWPRNLIRTWDLVHRLRRRMRDRSVPASALAPGQSSSTSRRSCAMTGRAATAAAQLTRTDKAGRNIGSSPKATTLPASLPWLGPPRSSRISSEGDRLASCPQEPVS